MNKMMLIVDDVSMNREILKVIFSNKYEILEAENGQEALTILDGCRGSIDVVLLDLVMKGLNGFDVLERRQSMDFFRKIPVIVITGSEHMEDQVKAFDLGANEYINKPFIPEIVLSRVNNVMASTERLLAIELEAEKMKVKSEIDEMTGLFNKTTSEFHMDKILKLDHARLNVLFIIDIDNFKAVNDTSGHQAGDHVIKIVANLISGLFRKTDIVGRIGGDEFCVLMCDLPSIELARSKVRELIQIMRYKPNLTIPEYVTLSIGMASNNSNSCSYQDLFIKADKALYTAKTSGKARYIEDGVDEISTEKDNRFIAVIISSNRNVCSTIQAIAPSVLKIYEILKIDDLKNLSEAEKERIIIFYSDVSDYNDQQESEFWNNLKSFSWVDFSKVFAICEEGNIQQYMSSIKAGVVDMFTTPIDHEAFKRRTNRYLEKIIETNG